MNNAQTVLVTGANGFVGRAVVAHLSDQPGYVVRRSLRRMEGETKPDPSTVVAEISSNTEWTNALSGVCAVVHTAALAQSTKKTTGGSIDELREVNIGGTLNLARQAAAANVKRFIFISSIKVFGEQSPLHHPFVESDVCQPKDAYANSKMEAEQGLLRIANSSAMEVVIIRAPVVYGPGVRANLHMLIRAVAQGVPLPLGAVSNRRSLVSIDNLLDFTVTCLAHSKAANEIFSISDGEDISTPELARRIGRALHRPARVLTVPVPILKGVAVLLGKQDIFQKLCGNLQVDIGKASRVLGWTPPVSVDEGLLRAVSGDRSC